MSYDLDFKDDVEVLADTVEDNQIQSIDPLIELRQKGEVHGVFGGQTGGPTANRELNGAIEYATDQGNDLIKTAGLLRDDVIPAITDCVS